VIVVKMQIQKRQTHLQITLSKLLIQPLLSKNTKRDTLTFTNRQDLNNVADFSSKKEIITTYKQTTKEKSAHKLHRLHRSYNKV